MKILESIGYVVEESANVKIDTDKVKDFADNCNFEKHKHWLTISPFDISQLDESEKVNFLFTLDSISFSYWGDPKWKVNFHGKDYDGTMAMIASLGKAIEEGINFSPSRLATLKREDLEKILKGNIGIPLLEERLNILKELGKITLESFNGDFRYIIDKSKNDALQLVDIIIKNFRSFEDSSTYKGKRIYFNKRAQLLASDISHFFGLYNVDKLTACADYKLPQILRRYGILQYSDELKKIIKSREEIRHGDEKEIEIRAHTIYAIEQLKKAMQQNTPNITSIQINDYLWLKSQVKSPDDKPYHLTRTIAY